jgi:cell division protein ZapB
MMSAHSLTWQPNAVLTRENAGNYSAGMQAELDALESKLALMLERYQSMRDETLKLRQQVVAMESNNKQLSEKLEEARIRTEALYNKIPD